MKYLKKFQNHDDYELFVDSEEFLRPNVSLCKTEWECHYTMIPYVERYLTFKILIGGTIVWKKGVLQSLSEKTISYSKDKGETWTDITSSTAGTSFNVSAGDVIMFKGDNITGYQGNGFRGSTAYYEVEGNIMSLLYGNNFETRKVIYYPSAFAGLFSDTRVVKAKNLVLPATDLSSHCYDSMFSNCTSLTTAPTLPSGQPSMSVCEFVYLYMFSNCTSLTTAPALPSTNLGDGWYYGMFYGCTNLESAPELPATALTISCYESMFTDCTSLTAAPELPATTLAEHCYDSMFRGCISLTMAPSSIGDSSTTVPASACTRMFFNCISLTTAPELPAISLGDGAYREMFMNCTSLTTVPRVLPATSLGVECYFAMFQSCTSLTTVPELLATTMGEGSCQQMFSDCIALTTVSNVLHATTLAEACYYSMFLGCTGLTTAPELPATTLATSCYGGMFCNCTSLTTAPELPAARLAQGCYQQMFANCTSLNSVTCLATGAIPETVTEEWLYGVAQTGIFHKYTTTSFSIGDSGIPTGWTVDNIEPDYEQEYLTLEILTGGYIIWNSSSSYTTTISYSIEDLPWQDATSVRGGRRIAALSPGQTIKFKGVNSSYGSGDTGNYCTFSGSTASFNVRGNIMSMIYGDDFTGTTLTSTLAFPSLFRTTKVVSARNLVLPSSAVTQDSYRLMFYNCTGLTEAPSVLPGTELGITCYQGMFSGCTSLTLAPSSIGSSSTTMAVSACTNMFYRCTSLVTAPELPVRTLNNFCYAGMFSGCTSLTTAPELPATALADNCYNNMFYGTNVLPDCSNIDFTSSVTVASGGLKGLFSGTKVTNSDLMGILPINLNNKYYLPATTLASGCYSSMFKDCMSLTTAPELPATTLGSGCYQNMFRGCTSLTTAPELPAISLPDACYDSMFYGCTQLAYIKALFLTDLGESSPSTSNWVYGVANRGTFVKNPEATWDEVGPNGVPNGWTIIYDGSSVVNRYLAIDDFIPEYEDECGGDTDCILDEYANSYDFDTVNENGCGIYLYNGEYVYDGEPCYIWEMVDNNINWSNQVAFILTTSNDYSGVTVEDGVLTQPICSLNEDLEDNYHGAGKMTDYYIIKQWDE